MTEKDRMKAALHRQIARRCKPGLGYWRQYKAEIHRLHNKIAWNEVEPEETSDKVLLKMQCLDELMLIAIIKIEKP